MNKLEEYLESIQQKELIYIFLSIPITIFVLYYNFVYPSMEKENKKLTKTITKKKKELLNVSNEIRKIKKSKKLVKPKRAELDDLKDDFRYIKYSFDTIDLLKLSHNKSYKLITKLLNKSKQLNLNSSFQIDWNKKTPPFDQTIEIHIEGLGEYLKIIQYIQYIENLEALIHIKNITISQNQNSSKTTNDILTPFIEKKQKENSSVSFILKKYSDKDINFFKHLSKQTDTDLSISIDKDNSNNLDISFVGDYSVIRNIIKIIKDKKERKMLDFYRLRANLKFNKNSSTQKKQKFVLNLKIVGTK